MRDTEQPLCAGPSRAGAPGPALSWLPGPLQPPARLSRVAEILPVSPSAPLLKLLSPLPVPCKFPHFLVLTVVFTCFGLFYMSLPA